MLNALILALAVIASSAEEPNPGEAPGRTVLPDEPVVIEADVSSGWFVVDVVLNGSGPHSMILDTGAMGVVLNHDLAAKLELPVIGQTRIGDPTNPEAHEADLVQVDSLRLGEAVFEGQQAVSWRTPEGLLPPGIRGIVGLPVFEHCLVTLDRRAGRVRIEKGQLPEPNGHDVLAIGRQASGLIELPIVVAGEPMLAHLDSGNPTGFVLPLSMMDELPIVEGSQVMAAGMRANGRFELTIAELDDKITIGDLVFERPKIKFDPGLPSANVGGTLFDFCVPTIDLANGRIRLGPVSGTTGGTTGGAVPARSVRDMSGKRRLGIQMSFSNQSDEMRVGGVMPGSLAERVGIEVGDILVEVNGQPVSMGNTDPLTQALGKLDAFSILVRRGEDAIKIQVPAEGEAQK